MRKVKYFIPLLILFLTIGFATVNQTLSIKGTATNTSNIDDFNVYYSDVQVNDIQDLKIVKNEKELVFTTTLEELGNQYKIIYDITNSSKFFDASFSVTCTQSNNYLKVTNELDTSVLPALSTRTGNLTLEKTQTNASETNTRHTVKCTITATPVERETTGTGEIPAPVERKYTIGEEIIIANETFNVISFTDTTVTMLAQYNLDTTYKQSTTPNLVAFSTVGGWTASPGPVDVDIQQYAGPAQTYVNAYVSHLKTETGDTSISGNLITLLELKSLGCTIPDDYSLSGTINCENTKYSDWLMNGQATWTRSTSPSYSSGLWSQSGGTTFTISGYSNKNAGIRPTITIAR